MPQERINRRKACQSRAPGKALSPPPSNANDQIIPIQTSAMLSSKIIKGAVLKVYKGAPHGMCTTLKDKVNADLLDFIEAKAARASGRAA